MVSLLLKLIGFEEMIDNRESVQFAAFKKIDLAFVQMFILPNSISSNNRSLFFLIACTSDSFNRRPLSKSLINKSRISFDICELFGGGLQCLLLRVAIRSFDLSGKDKSWPFEEKKLKAKKNMV